MIWDVDHYLLVEDGPKWVVPATKKEYSVADTLYEEAKQKHRDWRRKRYGAKD
jgi:hypothetical protein